MAIVLDGTTGITSPDVDSSLNGLAYPDASSMGFRNRIINGDMQIDQRNNGASVTLDSSTKFITDRWNASRVNTGGVITSQRSTVAPAGFTNSLLVTVGTGVATAATDYTTTGQRIEGFNVSDLAWGTASAVPAVMSFWVRSSVTGTFGFSIQNLSAYSFVGSYTINVANTWEYKTISIPAPTTSTFPTDNSACLYLNWDLGVGSTFSGAAGSWTASNVFGLTGGAKLSATTGATFYITGVQLEAGSVATPFERRPYGTELQLCQRYFEKSYDLAVVPGTNTADGIVMVDTYYSNARFIATHVPLMVPKRIGNWTLTYWDRVGNLSRTSEYSSATWADNLTSSGTFLVSQGQNRFLVYPSNSNDNAGFHFTASAEL